MGTTTQAQVPANVFSYSRVSGFTYETASVATKGLLKTETIEPDQADLCVVTSYGYDGKGNKNSATTSYCAGASSTAQFTQRTSSSDYATDGLFPVSSTNAKSQSETKAYDARFGALTSLTGPNSLTTTITVDPFGRKTKELRADNTSTVTAYCFVPGVISDPNALNSQSSTANGDPLSCPTPAAGEAPTDAFSFTHTETRNAAGTKMAAFVRVYSDRQGRALRTVTESFDGANQTAGRSLALIAQDSYYNPQGAKIGASQPYFLASGSSTTSGSNNRGISATAYDVLGRPIAVYSADPSGSQTNVAVGNTAGDTIVKASVVNYTYWGLMTITANDKGQTKKEEKNISGQVIRVTDASGAQLLHQHDAFGNLIETRDALQNKISISYDTRGRKIGMTDPDAGQSLYTYDALGQLVKQQNAKQIAASASTTMAYDVLGRMTSRVEPEYTSTWTYDSCTKGVGKLCSSTTTNGITKTVVYDSLGRPVNSRTDITSGPSFASSVTYDASTGRVATQTYPTGVQVGYSYTSAGGYLEKLVLNTAATVNPLPATVGGTPVAGTTLTAGTALWQAKVVNAWGKAEQSSTSNGVLAKAAFEAATGRVTDLQGTKTTANDIYDQGFTWDSLNNLTSRADRIGDPLAGAVSESFAYGDNLNRLTQYTVSAPGIPGTTRTVDLQYNALGMLLYKSDVGNYSYPTQGPTAVRPHALQTVVGASTNTSYGYDGNGNLSSATGSKYSSVTYTSFNLPDSNTGLQGPSGSPAYTWQYDENHQRIKETRTNASGTRTTWMLHPDNAGGLGFECESASSSSCADAQTMKRHYLTAGGQTIGVLVATGALPTLLANQTAPTVLGSITLNKVEYWHKDHLGSLIATTDHAGSVTARYAYDPFGKRRNINGSYDAFGAIVMDWTTNTNSGTDRGFTGHEQLDDIGLTHMNGRIYDANLGRFLQADPMIEAPQNLQSYNRYAYLWNNPLNNTDPTGFCFICDPFKSASDTIDHWSAALSNSQAFRAAAIIVISYYTAGAASSWYAGNVAAEAGFAAAAAGEQAAIIEAYSAAAYASASTSITAGVIGGAAGGAAAGFVASNGNFESTLEGGVAGAITGAFGKWQTTEWNLNDPSQLKLADVNSSVTHWDQVGLKVLAQSTSRGLLNSAFGKSFESGFKAALVPNIFNEVYSAYVPWQPNALGKTGEAAKKLSVDGTIVYRDQNNFGNWWSGLKPATPLQEGGSISSFVDRLLPGADAISKLHDVWAIKWASTVCESDSCYSTMLPAAAISYGSLISRYGQ